MKSDLLSTKVGNLELRNPTILAAGVLGLTGSTLRKVWNSGAGAVVTKSVGKKEKKGYTGPNVVGTPCGMLNAMGLPNPGIENELEETKTAKEAGATVIGSIFGETPEEFSDLADEIEEAGLDAVELNLSCPHAEEVSAIGHDPQLSKEVIEAVEETVDLPVWAKLPGNTHLSHFLEVADSAERGGADALVITNTVPGMAIDAKAERPILGNEMGGLSGPAIKPIGLRLVYEAYEETDLPIVGVGGVMTGEDLIEYVLAGASAVEIGTGITWRDLNIFEKVPEEASEYLQGRKISELVGAAHVD